MRQLEFGQPPGDYLSNSLGEGQPSNEKTSHQSQKISTLRLVGLALFSFFIVVFLFGIYSFINHSESFNTQIQTTWNQFQQFFGYEYQETDSNPQNHNSLISSNSSESLKENSQNKANMSNEYSNTPEGNVDEFNYQSFHHHSFSNSSLFEKLSSDETYELIIQFEKYWMIGSAALGVFSINFAIFISLKIMSVPLNSSLPSSSPCSSNQSLTSNPQSIAIQPGEIVPIQIFKSTTPAPKDTNIDIISDSEFQDSNLILSNSKMMSPHIQFNSPSQTNTPHFDTISTPSQTLLQSSHLTSSAVTPLMRFKQKNLESGNAPPSGIRNPIVVSPSMYPTPIEASPQLHLSLLEEPDIPEPKKSLFKRKNRGKKNSKRLKNKLKPRLDESFEEL